VLALVAGTLALWSRALANGFVSYDDPLYVLENPPVRAGLSLRGLGWAFTHVHASNWHPLTWLSHMLDVQLFGLAPAGHHATSVVLHALNAALLFLALRALTLGLRPALVVAALFAVHPLRVESVAWVAERKDVLAAAFFLAALRAHALAARGALESPYGRSGRARVAAWMALGLLAKPMVVTLPFVLLLVDAWPLDRARRLGWRRLTLEKAPLLALAALSCVATVLAQRAAGSVRTLEAFDAPARLANAALAWVGYAWRTAWPAGLACFYPHPAVVAPDGLAARALGALALLLSVTALAWALRRRAPWVGVGWAWYVGMLVPVIGLVQVGSQALADRYAYLPTIGLYLMVVPGAAALAARVAPGVAPRVRARLLGTLAGTVVLALGVATWRQIGWWRDGETLFRRAIAVVPDNYLAHVNLGTTLAKAGEHARAAEEFRAALAVLPGHAEAHNNLGTSLFHLGREEEAGREYEEAVRIAPDYAEAHYNLGLVRARAGRLSEAEAELERALRLRPDLEAARTSLLQVREALRQGTGGGGADPRRP